MIDGNVECHHQHQRVALFAKAGKVSYLPTRQNGIINHQKTPPPKMAFYKKSTEEINRQVASRSLAVGKAASPKKQEVSRSSTPFWRHDTPTTAARGGNRRASWPPPCCSHGANSRSKPPTSARCHGTGSAPTGTKKPHHGAPASGLTK